MYIVETYREMRYKKTRFSENLGGDMKNLKRCVEDVMSSGEIHHEIITSEFYNMDGFQEALAKEGLVLECNQWGKTRWFIRAQNAGVALEFGLLYRPKVWGVGVHRLDPCENGVELYSPNKIVMDGETSNKGCELILFEYRMSQGASSVHKQALARKPAPEYDVGSYWSDYHWRGASRR